MTPKEAIEERSKVLEKIIAIDQVKMNAGADACQKMSDLNDEITLKRKHGEPVNEPYYREYAEKLHLKIELSKILGNEMDELQAEFKALKPFVEQEWE